MNFTRERLRKLRRLAPGEILCLGQAWLLFWAIDLALRTMPFRSLLTCIHRIPASLLRLPLNTEAAAPRLAWLVERAAGLSPVNGTCLRQALVLLCLLRRRGQSGLVQIGVARVSGALHAHAWIEQDGQVLLGYAGDNQYTPLFP